MRFVGDGDGKKLMDELVARVAVLDAEQRRVLRQRADDVENAASTAYKTIIGGTLVCLVVITAAGFILTRTLTMQIASAVQHVQRSSNELQSAATQQAAGARESSTSMAEITTTITELLAASRQIAESAQRVAGVAEQTADAARMATARCNWPRTRSPASASRSTWWSTTCWTWAANPSRSARCWRSSPSWPSRPISSPSTRPSRPPARARRASASAWWRTRSASWRTGWPDRPRRSAA